jgi:hypothetical protein
MGSIRRPLRIDIGRVIGVDLEFRRSERFEQEIGHRPSWFDIVDQHTASQEMHAVKDQMLDASPTLAARRRFHGHGTHSI